MQRLHRSAWTVGLVALLAGPGCVTSTSRPTESALTGTRSERIAWLLNEVDSLTAGVDEFVRREAALGSPLTEAARSMDGPFSTELYEIAGLKLPALAEKRRYDVLRMLYEKLGTSQLSSIEYRGTGAVQSFQAPFKGGFKGVPTPVLLAAVNVVAPDKRGLEWDLVAPAKSGPAWRVTFRHELDGRLAIAAAESTSLPPVAAPADASPEGVRARYGIGPIENAGRSWTRAELEILDSALATLSAEERVRIRDLPFRRVRKVSIRPAALPRDAQAGGLYRTSQEGNHWIEIADAAFTTDEVQFVGEPSQPQLPSARAMLHEIGHAIAMRPTYEAMQLVKRIRHRQLRVVREVNRFTGKPVKPHEKLSLRLIREAFSEMNETLTPLVPGLSNAKRSPVLSAYAELPGIRDKPTSYGRTAIEESFAESFSLYRLDREALARVAPEAVAFFEAQRHLPGE